MIAVGDRLPEGELLQWDGAALTRSSVAEVAGSGRIMVIGVVSAFTELCTEGHMRDYIEMVPALKAADIIDGAICISAVDPFVMHAWNTQIGADGIVPGWSDPGAAFAQALGITADFSQLGLGLRSGRYSMLLRDGVVRKLNVEDDPSLVTVSAADVIYGQVRAA